MKLGNKTFPESSDVLKCASVLVRNLAPPQKGSNASGWSRTKHTSKFLMILRKFLLWFLKLRRLHLRNVKFVNWKIPECQICKNVKFAIENFLNFRILEKTSFSLSHLKESLELRWSFLNKFKHWGCEGAKVLRAFCEDPLWLEVLRDSWNYKMTLSIRVAWRNELPHAVHTIQRGRR